MKNEIVPDPIPLSLLEESTFEKLRLNFIRIVNDHLYKKGLNKSWLAHRLKISAPVVTKLLSGKSNPTLKTIADVCDILKIDPRLVILPKEEDEDKSIKKYRYIKTVNIKID